MRNLANVTVFNLANEDDRLKFEESGALDCKIKLDKVFDKSNLYFYTEEEVGNLSHCYEAFTDDNSSCEYNNVLLKSGDINIFMYEPFILDNLTIDCEETINHYSEAVIGILDNSMNDIDRFGITELDDKVITKLLCRNQILKRSGLQISLLGYEDLWDCFNKLTNFEHFVRLSVKKHYANSSIKDSELDNFIAVILTGLRNYTIVYTA